MQAKYQEFDKAAKKLNHVLRSTYVEQERPFTWLDSDQSDVSHYINLKLVDTRQVDTMVEDQATSSACEQERRHHDYAHSAIEEFIEVDALFTPGAVGASSENGVASGMMFGHCRCFVPRGQRVGILGGAGYGKTACCAKLAYRHSKDDLWPFFNLCLFWKLRERLVHKAKSLADMLYALLDPHASLHACERLARALTDTQGRGVLLVFDGIDELTVGEEAYVWGLLDGSVLPEACVLATSRFCARAKAHFRANRYKCLELIGFRDDQIDSFIDMRLGKFPGAAAGLKSFLDKNTALGSLMCIPLLALLTCEVWREDRSVVLNTKTKLFSRLLALIVRRAVGEKRVAMPHDSSRSYENAMTSKFIQDFVGRAKQLLLEIAAVANVAHESGLANFSRDFVRKANCSGDALQLGLLTSLGGKIDEVFAFPHLMFQEFLVAYHLSSHITKAKELQRCVERLQPKKKNYVVCEFLAGLHPRKFTPQFFESVSKCMHEDWDRYSEDSRDRLRLCLEQVKEVNDGDKGPFPAQLQLPKQVGLYHITAADLTLLATAVRKSVGITDMWLYWDKIGLQESSPKLERIKSQTIRAATKLAAGLEKHNSLDTVLIDGPCYRLFDKDGWKALLKAVRSNVNSLRRLIVMRCRLGDREIMELAEALRGNTRLQVLDFSRNEIGEDGLRALVASLQHIKTLKKLWIADNRFQVSPDWVKGKLGQVNSLFLGYGAAMTTRDAEF